MFSHSKTKDPLDKRERERERERENRTYLDQIKTQKMMTAV